jgi:glutamyl-tRNA(Gln) amidotransferase subunit D
MAKPKEGDMVRVTTEEETIEGMLLPRPDILEDDVTVIKLHHGYNIGINNSRIKKVEVLEERKEKKEKPIKITHNPKLPKVSILSTGGTIASRIDYSTGGVKSTGFSAEDFLRTYPELANVANIEARSIMNIMSEDMYWEHWTMMAKEIKKEIDKGADGVVITQGTDTLHFTSAALSFMLKDLSIPVIITASQRSIDRGSSDAFMNLVCAVKAAGNFEGAEVFTCLHGTSSDNYCILIRGPKARKMHTSRRDAFRPINELPIAKVHKDGNIEITNNKFKKRSKTKTQSDTKHEGKTALIQIYPGMDPEIIDFYLDKGYKGLVLAATALGHVPTDNPNHSLLPHLEKAMKQNIPVIIATQTLYGRVNPYVYTNLRKLSIQNKCIFAEDMTPETAYVKLGWVLGHTTKVDEVKKMMQTNIAGEINPIIDERSYLV